MEAGINYFLRRVDILGAPEIRLSEPLIVNPWECLGLPVTLSF